MSVKHKNFFYKLRKINQQKYSKYIIYIKYIISGGTAAFIDLLLLYILTDIFHIWYLLSSGIAYVAAIATSFTLQKYWTFNDRGNNRIVSQISIFILVSILNIIVNTVGMYLLVDKLQLMYLLAQIIIGGSIAFANFAIYKLVIFKKSSIAQ